MLYMLINRTRPDLDEAQYRQLAERAQAFYAGIPEGVTLHGDWAASDGSRTFALVEADDPALVEAIKAPFEGLVDIETVPVTALSGWRQDGSQSE